MQPMLRSPDFGTGFYMFYSDNLKNEWIKTHNSLSFYDRFYNVRTNWRCREVTDASASLQTTQDPSQPENNTTDSVPRKCPENMSQDAKVIHVSVQQQQKKHGLKRPLSEIESTSGDIQEVPPGENLSSKKLKKVKKHKHKHEGSKKRHKSSTETLTPDVIYVGESVADKDNTSRSGDIQEVPPGENLSSKKPKKVKKDKHKHEGKKKDINTVLKHLLRMSFM